MKITVNKIKKEIQNFNRLSSNLSAIIEKYANKLDRKLYKYFEKEIFPKIKNVEYVIEEYTIEVNFTNDILRLLYRSLNTNIFYKDL